MSVQIQIKSRRFLGLITAVLILALAPQSIEGQSDPKEKQIEQNNALLGIVNIGVENHLGKERVKRIKELIAVVQNDQLIAKDRLEIHKAMLRLGRLKAIEAAPAIVERLDLHLVKEETLIMQALLPPQVHYPAIMALSQIGNQTLPIIADAVAHKERNPRFKKNAFYTIVLITGHHDKAEQYMRERVSLYRQGIERLKPFIKGTQLKSDLPMRSPTDHPLRKWTDNTRKNTIEASLVELKQGKVHLKKADGTVISLPLNKLSKANQEYVKATFPETLPKKEAPK